MMNFTHLLVEAKSKYSPSIKPLMQTHQVCLLHGVSLVLNDLYTIEVGSIVDRFGIRFDGEWGQIGDAISSWLDLRFIISVLNCHRTKSLLHKVGLCIGALN